MSLFAGQPMRGLSGGKGPEISFGVHTVGYRAREFASS